MLSVHFLFCNQKVVKAKLTKNALPSSLHIALHLFKQANEDLIRIVDEDYNCLIQYCPGP